MLAYVVLGWIIFAIRVLTWLVFIDAILTWIPQVDRRNPLVVALRSITTPIYRPIRQLIPPERTGYIDLSPLIAIIGLQILGSILVSIVVSARGH